MGMAMVFLKCNKNTYKHMDTVARWYYSPNAYVQQQPMSRFVIDMENVLLRPV